MVRRTVPTRDRTSGSRWSLHSVRSRASTLGQPLPFRVTNEKSSAMADSPRFTRHMSDEDALMWNVEKDPILRSTIVAVALFDRPPDFERLRARIDRATCLIPRFRQHVQSPPFRLGPPRWSVESTFDLDFHLRRMRLPAPGTERTLLDCLQPMASAGFDRARPLWEFTLIEGLYDEDGTERAAFAMKVHHTVTDGVGGMALLALLVDLTPDATEPTDTAVRPAPESMNAVALIRDSMVHSARRMLGVGRRLPGTASSAAAATCAIRGTRAPSSRARPARSAGCSHPQPSRCRRSCAIAGSVAGSTCSISPLDDLQRAAKVTEGSVNDVFVAAILGGLHRYHERHGDCPDSLRMTLPINLRREGDDSGGNHFAPRASPCPPRSTIHATACRRSVRSCTNGAPSRRSS